MLNDSSFHVQYDYLLYVIGVVLGGLFCFFCCSRLTMLIITMFQTESFDIPFKNKRFLIVLILNEANRVSNCYTKYRH